MNYHITVNGIPHCQAPVYQLSKAAGLTADQMCDCSCHCGYGNRKAEAIRDAHKLALALPKAEVRVVDGKCTDDPWWKTPDGQAVIEIEDQLRNAE